MFLTLLFLLLGLVLLVSGAEALVRGASRLARALGVSSLVVGLTVVAMGTSSPELAVSVQSALSGQADIALGNIIGSNIFNILVILGLSALIAPLFVAQQIVRLDVPVMLAISFGVFLMASDGVLRRAEGLLLLAVLALYILWLIRLSRREQAAVLAEYEEAFGDGNNRTARFWVMQIALVAGGLVMLAVGSRLLVDSAVAIAQVLGVSELVIGLTIVAAGTSLPEVATSVVATLRGERDIAVGNVIGSNTFNLLGVLGLSSLVAPQALPVAPAMLSFDLPVMIGVALACLPIFFTGHLIARWEGALFLAYYAAYMAYLLLAAQRHDLLDTYAMAMATVVLPLTAVTLAVFAARHWRARRQD
ncbi:MAG: calcium/sodium antiporter [Caldilineales bacterium]|nr:calcium/sodium antiporter [Caldilineales bacterium]